MIFSYLDNRFCFYLRNLSHSELDQFERFWLFWLILVGFDMKVRDVLFIKVIAYENYEIETSER